MKTVKCFLVKISVIFLFTWLTPHLVSAQISSVTNETRNNTTTTGYQTAYWWSLRTVAVQPDGGYIIVWIDAGNDGQGTGIYGQRFNANGTKAGSEFLVNTTTAGDQYSPAIAVAPDGSFLVAWEGPGSSIDAFAQKFTKLGVKDGTEFLLNTSVSGNQRYPEIQFYPDGTFVAAFVDGAQTVLQRFDSDNRTIGQETRISSGSGNVVLDGLCVRADNSVLLYWTAGADVYGQLFNYNLNSIGVEKRLNTYTAGTQQYVLGRADAAGNIVFAWESDGQDGSGNGVYYRRYDNNFNALTANELAITTNTTGDQFGATVAMEPGGRFLLSWTDNNNRDGGGGSPLLAGAGASIWFREFNSSGTAIGSETLINQSVTGYQGYTLADVNASGKLVFAWEGNGTLAGNIDDVGSFSRTYQFSQTGINAALTVSPSTVIASDIVTITMTLTSPLSTVTNVIPNPLSVSGTNGVFATYVSGPTPSSATVGLAPVTFTWTYKITAEEQTGTLSFSGNARTSNGVIFPYNTSNTINVKPAIFVTDMTAPNLVCDANSPLGGPQVFTIGARVTNGGLTNLTNVYAYLGDGVTPGTFPTTTMTLAQTNNTYQGTFALSNLADVLDCSRSLVSLGAAKNVIAGAIDFNGDGSITTADDGVLSNGRTVIDGRIDVNLSGTITTTDDYTRPPGVFTGYRAPGIIDGYADTNNDGVINASDNSTYGGESKVVYWQVKYSVKDAYDQPTSGNASDFNDDLRYRWKVWVSGNDGTTTRTDEVREFARVRSELSAAANKIVPSSGFISTSLPRVIGGFVDVNSDAVINGSDDGIYYGKTIIDGKVDMNNSGTITTTDDGAINTYFPVIDGLIDMVNDGVINSSDAGVMVVPGQTISVTFNNATFGTIGAGFDENRDNLFDYDMWHQPVGAPTWLPNAFRLVNISSNVTGTGGSNPLNGITTFYDNEPYLSRLVGDIGGAFDITYTYTFLVLRYQNAFLTPYQEAASGTNNEKYNNDFPTVGINLMTLPPYLVLPATGLSASAVLNNNTAQVSWKTETEVNCSHFILERSNNGTEYAAIATVQAKGNSIVTSEYQYPDNLSIVNKKIIYYRIKQIDADGKVSYSNVVPVRLVAAAEVAVWPNPFISNITVNINSPLPDVVTIAVYDMNGKLVKAKQQSVFAGSNQLQVNGFDALPSGIYTVNVTGGLLQKSFLLKKE
jgi:Secretion system C-terminal sorting domain